DPSLDVRHLRPDALADFLDLPHVRLLEAVVDLRLHVAAQDDGFVRLAHALQHFHREFVALAQVGDRHLTLEARVHPDLQRLRLRLPVRRESHVVGAGYRRRSAVAGGPHDHTLETGEAGVTHVPEEAVETGLRCGPGVAAGEAAAPLRSRAARVAG